MLNTHLLSCHITMGPIAELDSFGLNNLLSQEIIKIIQICEIKQGKLFGNNE